MRRYPLHDRHNERPPRGGDAVDLVFIGIVSAAILGYQLLLTRILAVHYWAYFASMIVSLAMLGFAASGTVLFLLSRRRNGTAPAVFWMTLCFAVSMTFCPRISEMIDCMPLVVLWNPEQLLWFAANYLVLSLPFFFGGFIIGHFFVGGRLSAGRVYFANMLGSGVGILIALAGLTHIRPSHALCVAAIPVLLAAWPRFVERRRRAALLAALLLVPIPMLFAPDRPAISPYKSMSGLLLVPDAEVEHAAWNPFGYAVVVDSRTIRYAPGLSLSFPGRIPAQKAIFTNGDDMEAVCRADDLDNAELRIFYDSMLSGLSYRFHDRPRMLIAGAGGGMDVLGALVHDAERIHALENNTAIVGLMRGPLSNFTGSLYERPGVELEIASARATANRTTNRYDLVVIPARRSLFASSAGTSASDPDYLMTREAISDFFSVLAPGGFLVMETWLSLPPRHGIKLFATAAEALKARGLDPGRHLVMTRSLRTSLLLVARDPVTPAQVDTIREFCSGRSFDRVHHPGITPDEVNRFNVVEDAPYFSLCARILENPRSAYRRHLFRISPPSDDRPYFSHFFKWQALPQLLSKTGQNVAIHIGWGYMFLLITLVQAIPLGALLILVPLFACRPKRMTSYPHRGRVYLYFSALGIGFMFLELAAIQQFARFLPHPVYAFGITVGVVLFFSGIGALFSSHGLVTRARLFGAILVVMALHLLLWQLSIGLRSTALFYGDVAVVALLSFFMGMPFPRGVARLQTAAPPLVPWAWAINGFISVLAVLAAGLAALSLGLSALVGLAILAYAIAGLTFPPARR